MKPIGILVFLSLVLFSCASETGTEISGNLEAGLRILPVEGDGQLEYTIYRGDYIVFDLPAGENLLFSIPELGIEETLPKPESETPYIKMKESGEFRFTLGRRAGILHVLELDEANYTEVTAQEMSELIANIDPLILDVRTEGEYAGGHVANSVLIPVQVLAEQLPRLEEYKNETIIVYCASGNRSTVASKLLIDEGFTKVYNLRSGIGGWIRAGYPVERKN